PDKGSKVSRKRSRPGGRALPSLLSPPLCSSFFCPVLALLAPWRFNSRSAHMGKRCATCSAPTARPVGRGRPSRRTVRVLTAGAPRGAGCLGGIFLVRRSGRLYPRQQEC